MTCSRFRRWLRSRWSAAGLSLSKQAGPASRPAAGLSLPLAADLVVGVRNRGARPGPDVAATSATSKCSIQHSQPRDASRDRGSGLNMSIPTQRLTLTRSIPTLSPSLASRPPIPAAQPSSLPAHPYHAVVLAFPLPAAPLTNLPVLIMRYISGALSPLLSISLSCGSLVVRYMIVRNMVVRNMVVRYMIVRNSLPRPDGRKPLQLAPECLLRQSGERESLQGACKANMGRVGCRLLHPRHRGQGLRGLRGSGGSGGSGG